MPGVILDPFAGSGTTLAVARRMGRRAVGVELQSDYLPLIQRRVRGAALPLLEGEATEVVERVRQPRLFEEVSC
jgi:tRNA G10  N-methylase Trm11